MQRDPDCIFCKIVAGEIPCCTVLETDDALAFMDIGPIAPGHVLLIPKKEISSLAAAEAEDQALLGHLMMTLRKLAEQLGLQGGFRVVANSGPDGGQTVDHLHFHLLGGRQLEWPPG